MTKKSKQIISCSIVLLLILSGLFLLSKLTERKDSYSKYEPFYQQEENFDVLFFGTSHMLNGIFPMELWNDYGIVSYNFAGHSNSIALSYWQMINAFDYTSPRLVVIDCMGLSANSKISSDPQTISYAHLSLDAIPLSKNKLRTVNDLTDSFERKMEFLFDFTLYHNRWKELEKNDLKTSVTAEKGAESRVNVAVPRIWSTIEPSRKLTEDTEMVNYLRKIIEECQARNVEVLLTYLPFPASVNKQMEANRVYDIAAEYHVNYLDLETLKSTVDFYTDLYDNTSHLNPSGARKVTDYVGKYIMEHYHIPNQKDNSAYAGWFDDYQKYTKYKVSLFKEQKELKSYLMLLNDKNFSYSIYIAESSQLLADSVIASLLENSGVNLSKLADRQNLLVTVDRLAGTVSYADFAESSDTSFGTVTVADTDERRVIFVNGEEKLKMNMNKNIAAGIVVYNNADKKTVSSARFAESAAEFETVSN